MRAVWSSVSDTAQILSFLIREYLSPGNCIEVHDWLRL